MRLMRKHDPQLQEDGFHMLRPHAAEHVDELIAEFRAEKKDHGLRCWLVELIGDARSEAARPLLTPAAGRRGRVDQGLGEARPGDAGRQGVTRLRDNRKGGLRVGRSCARC